MSKSGSGASDEALGGPPHDPVYDFLYHDARRTYSFLGQLDPSGHLTGIKQSETASETQGEEGTIQTTANVAVAKGVFGHKRAKSSVGGEAVERAYDPFWANALEFRDYLLKHGLVRYGLENARIGQFVLVSGTLTVMDVSLFKGMWSVPAVRAAIQGGASPPGTSAQPNRRERRAAHARSPGPAQAASQSSGEAVVNAGIELMGMLPHTIQAQLAVSHNGPFAWASLKEEGLVISAADIMLKHGVTVAGEWNVLGVLDAFPETDPDGKATEAGTQGFMGILSLADTLFGRLMFEMLPHVRPLLGRPFSAYGVTPLMIFREIAA